VLVVILAALLALLPAPILEARRAISVVKTTSAGSADDQVIDFGSATSASNVVVAGYRLATDTATVDVAGVVETVIHVYQPTGIEIGILCWVGGSQTYTFTTSGGTAAAVAAIEVSGTDGCTEDGTSDDRNVTGSSPTAADAPPTIQAGSLVFGTVWAGNSANFSCDGSYTCIPSDGTDIGGFGLAQWRIAPTTTTYDSPFTWSGTENTFLAVAGIAATASGSGPCLLMLMGIGRC
jgi:hypothetical protein